MPCRTPSVWAQDKPRLGWPCLATAAVGSKAEIHQRQRGEGVTTRCRLGERLLHGILEALPSRTRVQGCMQRAVPRDHPCQHRQGRCRRPAKPRQCHFCHLHRPRVTVCSRRLRRGTHSPLRRCARGEPHSIGDIMAMHMPRHFACDPRPGVQSHSPLSSRSATLSRLSAWTALISAVSPAESEEFSVSAPPLADRMAVSTPTWPP